MFCFLISFIWRMMQLSLIVLVHDLEGFGSWTLVAKKIRFLFLCKSYSRLFSFSKSFSLLTDLLSLDRIKCTILLDKNKKPHQNRKQFVLSLRLTFFFSFSVFYTLTSSTSLLCRRNWQLQSWWTLSISFLEGSTKLHRRINVWESKSWVTVIIVSLDYP